MKRLALIFALVSCVAVSAFAEEKTAPASAPAKKKDATTRQVINMEEDERIDDGPTACRTITTWLPKRALIKLRNDFNSEMIQSLDDL